MKIWGFKAKVVTGVIMLVFAVGSFLAANNIDPISVDDSEDGNIDVEFKDADINDVFRVLALKGNVSIVADPDVKGLVTVSIQNVPWEKALDVICRTYGYAYERESNIIRVTTLDKQGQENLVTEVFPLNYAKAADVAAAVGEMRSERGKIKFDSRSNLVIVTDIPTNIYKIAKVIARLDTITPQVTIEAKIIETNFDDAEDLGLKWNAQYTMTASSRPTTFPWPANQTGSLYNNWLPNGDDGSTFPTTSQPAFPLATVDDFSYGILDGSSLSLLLQAIQTKTKTKTLSNPRITTLDNEPAEIHVGTDWPIANYSYNEETDRFVITGWEYKSYGILLQVTPTINKNGYVTLKLHPEISDQDGVIDFQGAQVPILVTQSADATVMIKDGDTLVIGGLLKDKKVKTISKVPFLGDIPILGLLFTHKKETLEKNDLLIFITPHIISGEKMGKRVKITKVLDETKAADDLAKAKEEKARIQELIADDDFPDEDLFGDELSDSQPEPAVVGDEQNMDPELEQLLAPEENTYKADMQVEQTSHNVTPTEKTMTKKSNYVIEDMEPEKMKQDKALPKDKGKQNKGYLFKKE